MNKSVSILLVEDDIDVCANFVNLTENDIDLNIVAVTNNSIKAISLIEDFYPDILILDIELHSGGGSGIDVLKTLPNVNIPKLPYILVTTNNSSDITHNAIRQLGADYIMTKYQENYSEKYVIDFIKTISPIIKSKKSSSNIIPPAEIKQNVKRKVMNELNLIGISQKSKGYLYLVDAIIMIIDNRTENLYGNVAKLHNKTESSVERAMQNSINRAWATSDINDLLTFYTAKINSSKGVPTLTEFIYYYANKIKY